MKCARKENVTKPLRLSLYLVTLNLLLTVIPVSLAQTPPLTTIDCFGADGTIARGINARGDIVGRYDSAGKTHGFLRKGGICTPIDFDNATLTIAGGINDKGEIVGQYTSAGSTHGFLLSQGIFTSIDFPDATFTAAAGINNEGEIVGQYRSADNKAHGFLRIGDDSWPIEYPGASATVAFAINANGKIAGTWLDSAGCGQGFVVNDDSIVSSDFPNDPFTVEFDGARLTSARAINNEQSKIVGFYNPAVCNEANARGYLLSTDGFVSIDYPGATRTEALSINASGEVVGYYVDAAGKSHGFLRGKEH